MSKLAIKDLATSKELDREAMSEVAGGSHPTILPVFPSIDVLSPDFYNMVTPITGAAEVPTMQTNNLVQSDVTAAGNGYGANVVSNNKGASQYNGNSVSGFLNPAVGVGRRFVI